ncbi:MAG: hypothetical protein WBE34_18730 [Candidatus Nitrosopolaris sp.]
MLISRTAEIDALKILGYVGDSYNIMNASSSDTINKKKQKLVHSTYRIKEDTIRALQKAARHRGRLFFRKRGVALVYSYDLKI